MCGATSQQKQLAGESSAFYSTMTTQAQQVFGDTSNIYRDLVSTFSPIVAAGPNQQGFSQEESTALNSQATEGTAQTYDKASKALAEQQAARGGGNEYIPSGADQQQREQLASSAAANESAQKLGITEANYTQGRQNWITATSGLAGAPNAFNPANSFEQGAVRAGDSATTAANNVAEADNSWVNAAIGALGGVAGAAAGAAIPKIGAGNSVNNPAPPQAMANGGGTYDSGDFNG